MERFVFLKEKNPYLSPLCDFNVFGDTSVLCASPENTNEDFTIGGDYNW